MARFRWFLGVVLIGGMSTSGLASAPKANVQLNRLPLTFELNQGQVPSADRFVMHDEVITALFLKGAVDFRLIGGKKHSTANVIFRIVGNHTKANPVGIDAVAGQSNYLIGSNPSRWITHIANYSRVEYSNLYPGISLVFYGSEGSLEHDFVVGPRADPGSIKFRLSGARRVALASDGNLRIATAAGTMILKRPVAYQKQNGKRKLIGARFHLARNGQLSFTVGPYNHQQPLVIDPVLVFSTYLDGSLSDEVRAVTADSSGNVYVTGTATSADFPVANAEQPQLGCSSGCSDAFITKLAPDGKTLIYSTYIGGSGDDRGASIEVDANGDAIIAGVSSSADFPHAGSVPALSCQTNDYCYFLASLKPDGSALNYSGMVGGSEGDYANGLDGRIALDSSGDVYLAGLTNDSSFQITSGTLSSTVNGYPYDETFVMKFSPTGSLVYSTVIPSIGPTNTVDALANLLLPAGIVVDSSGQATIAGSAGPGMPVTSGVVGSSYPNITNASSGTAGYVLQLNANASAINFASYAPGTDTVGGMTVDSSGNIYLTGGTSETNLPVSANAYQSSLTTSPQCTCSDGYILKLNSTATSVLGATYLNGPNGSSTEGTVFGGIALDSSGNIFVGGMTGSSDFPLRNPLISAFESSATTSDMVLAELSPDLSTLKFGSFLSSTTFNGGATFGGLAVDSSNNLIVGGRTYAANFPTTSGSYEQAPPPSPNPPAGYIHSFVAKIDMATAAPSFCPSMWEINTSAVALASSQGVLNVTNCGNAPLDFSSIVSSDPVVSASQDCSPVAPGAVCPVTITLSPVSDALTRATVSFSDNAAISPQVIPVNVQGMAASLYVQPDPVSFGSLYAGTQGPPLKVVVINEGNVTATFSSVSISGSSFSITNNQCVSGISANNECFIDLQFAPSTAGEQTGTLTIASNDPVHPQLAVKLSGMGVVTYPTPVVTGTEQIQGEPVSTLPMNQGDQNLTIFGSNFFAASVARFNGAALATTFVSNTEIKATIPGSALNTLGEFPLTVVNPSPGGGTSAAFPMTTYDVVALTPSALVSVPASGMLYAAIPATASTDPNTVVPIDPATGAEGTPIPVGNDPRFLAASSDGSYLFVALAGDLTVQRISLKANAVDRTFPYSPDPSCLSCRIPLATDLQTIPGSPTEVVLAQGGEVSLYNDSGLVNYVPTGFVGSNAPTFDSITFAGNPLALYALPFTTVQNPFFTTAAITTSGLQYTTITSTNYGSASGTGEHVVSDGTLLYTDSGEVWNPGTEGEVGTFASPLTSDYNSQDITVDAGLNEVFELGMWDLGPGSMPYEVDGIAAFDKNSLATLRTLTFVPQRADPSPFGLVRWGQDGFAFAMTTLSTTSGIYLVRSQALTSTAVNPVPSITSVTGSYSGDNSSMVLAVDGANFVSGSAVNWNGTELATNYKSSTELMADVSPAELYGSVTAQVTVTNPAPGGGTSPAFSFTLPSTVPTVTLSNNSISFGQVMGGASSTAQAVSITDTGAAFLEISSIRISGGFSETNNCGSVAPGTSCQVQVTFTPTTVGSTSGSLTITDNASGGTQTVALSGSGVAPYTFGTQSGGSTLATVTSGGTATYQLEIIGANGFSGNVAIACTGTPIGSTCSVKPASLSVTSGGSQNFTVSVNTSSSVVAMNHSETILTFAGIGIVGILLLPIFLRVRRGIPIMLGMVVVCVLISLSGCGSGGTSGSGGAGGSGSTSQSTPAGNYTLTLTASTGSFSTSERLSLKVQ